MQTADALVRPLFFKIQTTRALILLAGKIGDWSSALEWVQPFFGALERVVLHSDTFGCLFQVHSGLFKCVKIHSALFICVFSVCHGPNQATASF